MLFVPVRICLGRGVGSTGVECASVFQFDLVVFEKR